jgi:hypothetical protein
MLDQRFVEGLNEPLPSPITTQEFLTLPTGEGEEVGMANVVIAFD